MVTKVLDEDPMALVFVHDDLKADINIVQQAFKKDKNSLKFASEDITIEIIDEDPM